MQEIVTYVNINDANEKIQQLEIELERSREIIDKLRHKNNYLVGREKNLLKRIESADFGGLEKIASTKNIMLFELEYLAKAWPDSIYSTFMKKVFSSFSNDRFWQLNQNKALDVVARELIKL